ncbi:porphobilinogen deaminase, partial [Phakopsora pachyrhizi]
TKELEFQLLKCRIDLIVQPLKDIPTTQTKGCNLGTILKMVDPKDALVLISNLPSKSLSGLTKGLLVGKSSLCRVAQLRRRCPQLEFQDILSGLSVFTAS